MKKGFTLLELIVVVVIIGILATLGFSQYSTQVENARTAEAKARLGLMRNYAMEYYFKNGTLVGGSNDINAISHACSSDTYWSTNAEGWDFMRELRRINSEEMYYWGKIAQYAVRWESIL